MNAELYAAVYAREFPAQALLRLRPELRGKAVVGIEGEPLSEFVCSANDRGYALGLQRGMTRPQLEVQDDIHVVRRSLAEEQSAGAALFRCVHCFSPRVEELAFDRALGFGADISGTEKLLGSAETIARNLRRRAQAMGICVSVAISCNFHAALCWARANPEIRIIPQGEEEKTLAPLPIDVLGLTPEQHETFSLWGIHTLGALAALPEVSLVARLGQEGKRLRQLARGEHPHLLKPTEQELEFKEQIEFEAGVESLDSVMFVLSPMLQQLSVRAQSQALALAVITVTCGLEGGSTHQRTIRPVLPTVDHAALLKLVHLDLITHPPSAAVLAIEVTAETNPPRRAQLGLFSPQFPEPMRLEVTLARLAAVVGSSERVGTPALLDSRRRDSFRMMHFAATEDSDTKTPVGHSRIALRILRPAEPVFVQTENDSPCQFVFRLQQYQAMEAYGPWHSDGDWWKPERWSREQWDVVARSRTGETLCCQLSFDPLIQAWQVEALYD